MLESDSSRKERQERQIIADSLKKLGTAVMQEGWRVPIGNSLWSSTLYRHGIFPAEGTVIEARMHSPQRPYAVDWTEGYEVVVNGEEVLSLGNDSDPIAPVSICQSLEYAGDNPDQTGGFSIFHDVFPNRVERHALAVLGPAAALDMGEGWFRQHGVDMSEVVVAHCDDELSPIADIPATRIPADEFAVLAAQLMG